MMNLPVNAGAPGWQVEGVVLENHLEKEMAVTPVFLPGKFHGWSSLVGFSMTD